MSFLFHCPDIIHNIYIDILNTMGPTYVMMEYLEKKIKYFESNICDDGIFRKEIKTRLDMATSIMSRLSVIWTSKISINVCMYGP